MILLTLLAFYILGILTGACGLVAITLHLAKKDPKLALAEAPKTKPTKASLDERMERVKAIINEQLDLLQAADGPQKNSLDGKYKNGLNRTVKDLEKEKVQILQSILADGFDPEITTQDHTGVVHKLLLSEFMAETGALPPPPAPVKPKSPRIGKFTIHKGGKDDGSGNTSH